MPDGSGSYDIRPDPGSGADRTVAVFDREIGSARDARAWLTRFLRERSVETGVCDDATLVVSELVTNALRYGDGPTVLRASLTDDTVQVSVTDSGDDLPELQPVDPERIGGLGLVVVDQLSREWGVARFPGGKTVWATLARRH